jgi:hypothetical protein
MEYLNFVTGFKWPGMHWKNRGKSPVRKKKMERGLWNFPKAAAPRANAEQAHAPRVLDPVSRGRVHLNRGRPVSMHC